MKTYCGADCEGCPKKGSCKGCVETCGSPFGGRCVAAEYIKAGGLEAYQQFKRKLIEEINALLEARGISTIDTLYELVGEYVNLAYRIPSGETVRFLNDKNVYLGAQIEIEGLETCCGVVADTDFILICSYGEGGSNPELITYQKR